MESDSESILDKVLSSKQSTDIQNFNPSETIVALCKHLTSKEEEILRRRFGLRAEQQETLEEIGKRFNVTRERIRQIEDTAIRKLRGLKEFSAITGSTEELVRQILEQHGGAMKEDELLAELFTKMPVQESDRREVLFLLDELFSERFDRIGKTEGVAQGWKLHAASMSTVQETIDQIVGAVQEAKKPMTFDELFTTLGRQPYFQQHPERHTEQVVKASVGLSASLSSNPFDEYGLVSWGTIVPKRMNDKIYLVLKRRGKPMHFTEITQSINETGFDKRKAYPPTVHNELILNDQYVLVGRGMYALKEWGYRPGVVADVLVDILRTAGKPLSRDELVRRVLEQRVVKKNTVHLALADRSKFRKRQDDTYELVAQTQGADDTQK